MPVRRLLALAAALILAVVLLLDVLSDENPPDPPRTAPGRSAGPRPVPGPPSTVVASIPAVVDRPRPVRARVGDVVRLSVAATRPDSVTIQGYDRVEPVDPDTPARFSFLAERPGEFEIRLTSSGRIVGVLLVGLRRPAGPAG
jgi:hypothetical protein